MDAIEITDIRKKFGGPKGVEALKGISFNVPEGEFFGLLGHNGAGKTTLINILAGLVRPTSGSARVMGHDVVTNFRQARQKLGVVPQELVFDPFFTVREILQLQCGYYGVIPKSGWIDELLHLLGLTPQADKNMRTLSGGMKRRVLVAQALVHKPSVIMLDEPTAGVDVELRQGLWNFVSRLNREGRTIILTTHYLQEAEKLCTRIAMLSEGKVVALDQKEALLTRFSGLELHISLVAGQVLSPELLAHFSNLAEHKENQEYRFRLRSYDEIAPILNKISNSGCHFEEIKITKSDLEEVFLQMMHTKA